MSQPTVAPITGWPPPGNPMPGEAGLPSADAVALSRFTAARAGALTTLPVLLFGTYVRLVRSGVPISRIVNPGTVATLVVTVLVTAVVSFRLVGRVTLVGGPGWLARRGLFRGEWVVIPFEHVRIFSSRLYRRRGGATVVVAVGTDDGRRARVAIPATSPAAEALPAALRAVATEEPPSVLPPMSRSTVIRVTSLILALALLPMVFFALGPLRVLPRAVAGEFTWSGCRAVLAAERDPAPARRTTYLPAQVVADGTVWRLQGTGVVSADQYAAHTEHPLDRLRNLTRDGVQSIWFSDYRGPGGEVAVVTMLRFTTAAGASAYDDHVNRAVCETEFGSHGPMPTGVRLFRHRGEVVRWVEANTILEVGQTSSQPFTTAHEVTALAGALTTSRPTS